MGFALRSSDFDHEGEIPQRCTCEGEDVSPALSWSGAPQGTSTYVLVIDDPDAPDPKAPKMTWVHWVLYDLPGTTIGLAQGIAAKDLPRGTRQGRNDGRRTGYGGPCPPIGRHRYFHKLFALSARLGDLGEASWPEIERAMKGKVLGQATLMGTYQKRGR